MGHKPEGSPMRTPLHLWIVGLLSLLWNASSALDFVMAVTGNQSYLAMMTDAQRAYMSALPSWFVVAWAIGVWGAMAGSVLLLLRSRYAATAFLGSILGMIAASVYSYGLASPNAIEISGTVAIAFSVAIIAVAFALRAYARLMTRRGVLG